jgi:hypothetical protein
LGQRSRWSLRLWLRLRGDLRGEEHYTKARTAYFFQHLGYNLSKYEALNIR